MGMCAKCCKMAGMLYLGLGVLMLLKDLEAWGFWGINWWTGVLIIFGFSKVMANSCADCKKACK